MNGGSEWRSLGPVIAAVVALFGWIAKHISNRSKHPCSKEIVFRDVCDQRHQSIIHTLGEHKTDATARYNDLKGDIKAEFAEVKQLIRMNGRH